MFERHGQSTVLACRTGNREESGTRGDQTIRLPMFRTGHGSITSRGVGEDFRPELQRRLLCVSEPIQGLIECRRSSPPACEWSQVSVSEVKWESRTENGGTNEPLRFNLLHGWSGGSDIEAAPPT